MQRRMKFLSFWSINDGVRTEPLCKQLSLLKAHGIEGVVFHPRFYPGDPGYMTPAFIQTVGEVILYAKSLGMEFWIYDENGWPSGSADGQVLRAHPESRRMGLVCTEESALQKGDTVLCRHGGKVIAARGTAGVSPLCRATTETFLALTHERYFRELPREAFDYVTGFFCDEVDYFPFDLLAYGAVPWCEELEAFYTEKYGESPCGELWKLFDTEREHTAFKIRFWETAGDLIARNFYAPYADWCERHGKLFTGHLKGEESPCFQLMFSGSCLTQMKHLSVPAVDTLERFHGNHFFPYLPVSAAARQGRGGCLAEAMGGAGWGVLPGDLKRYMLWLAEAGVERVVLHLGQLLLKARAIRDWPPSMPLHLSWHGSFAEVLEEIRKEASPLLERAWEADTLVVIPTRGVMAHYRPHGACKVNLHDGSGIPDGASARINAAFLETAEACYRAGLRCHFTEERELGSARTEGDAIVLGAARYKRLLVAEGCVFEKEEKAFLDRLEALGMLCGVPSGGESANELPPPAEAFAPPQSDWTLERITENQMLISWERASDGVLTASVCVKNAPARMRLCFSDPVGELTANAEVCACGDEGTSFVLKNAGDVLKLCVKPTEREPLPFAWLRGDFAVLSRDGWREFDERQITCGGEFLLDGSREAVRLSPGELAAQGLPFFGGTVRAEKRFTLTEDLEGALNFDQLSVAAAVISIDGGERKSWWRGRDLAVRLCAGEHTLSIDAVPSTYNAYGPHRYYLGDCRLTSPDTFFGRGGYTDNADAPENTFVQTMQFVKFAVEGRVLFARNGRNAHKEGK